MHILPILLALISFGAFALDEEDVIREITRRTNIPVDGIRSSAKHQGTCSYDYYLKGKDRNFSLSTWLQGVVESLGLHT